MLVRENVEFVIIEQQKKLKLCRIVPELIAEINTVLL